MNKIIDTFSNATEDYELPYGRIDWKVGNSLHDDMNVSTLGDEIPQLEYELPESYRFTQESFDDIEIMSKSFIRDVATDITAKNSRIILRLSNLITFELSTVSELSFDFLQFSTEKIFQEFYELFVQAETELFEDGVESLFAKQLTQLIKEHGEKSFDILISLADKEKLNPEVISEALRWIGRMDSSLYYQHRKWLLEYSLNNPSVRVRDGAVLGLGSMDDPNSMPYVEKALEREENFLMRRNMQQLLEQLHNTTHEKSADYFKDNEPFQTMLASEEVLKKEWNTEEEDEAWSHL